MIRFAWLRFRTRAAIALGALVIIAAILALTGFHMADVYNTTVAGCHRYNDCAAVLQAFPPAPDRTVLGLLDDLVIAVPGLIGIFWGAPLVAREFEAGTFRLAWTQGISRTRWLAVKLGVVGAFSMIVAGLLSLMATWWSSPFDQAYQERIGLAVFHTGGIVPVGYAAFAFALGVTAGMFIRRTLPAMAVTLVIFAAVRLAVPFWVRPHLIPPVTTTSALNLGSVVEWGVTNAGRGNGGGLFVQTQPNVPGAWLLSNKVITPAGRPVSTEPATQAGGVGASTWQACRAYVATLHLRQSLTYQPASRYWALQWLETAIYLAGALLLSGLCFLRIRRGRPAGGDVRRRPGEAAVLQSWRRPAASHQSV
jgi:ABC-type transport system involved in multi-copper enzyme maturation permease subunit